MLVVDWLRFVHDQILARYCSMLSTLPGLEFGISPSYMNTRMDTNKHWTKSTDPMKADIKHEGTHVGEI